MPADLAHRPRPARVGAGDVVQGAAAGIVLDVAHLVVGRQARQVDARVARHEDEPALGVGQIAIGGELGLRLALAGAEHDGQQGEHLDRRAPARGGRLPDRRDARRDDLRGGTRHEHAFGVAGGEVVPPRRAAGLEQHGRALRRRLAEVDGVDLVMRPAMGDAPDPGRVDVAAAVVPDGVVRPAAFPQRVHHLHELVGDVVALVMRSQARADAARGAGEVAGHDVPAKAPAGEVVERRHAPGEQRGRLGAEVDGDAEAEPLRHQGHGGNEHGGIVHRHLHAAAQRRRGRTAVHVVGAEHVGDEHGVEAAAFEQAGEVGPVLERRVVPRPVVGVPPQARRLVHRAVHDEGVEEDVPPVRFRVRHRVRHLARAPTGRRWTCGTPPSMV